MVTMRARRYEAGRPSAALRLLSPRHALLALGTLLLAGSLAAWMVTGGPTQPAAALATTGCFALGLVALVAAAVLPAPLAPPAGSRRGLVFRLAEWPLAVALVLTILATGWLAGDLLLHAPLDPSVYASDAAAFNHYDADLVLHGVNPYTADARFWDALRRFPSSAATPLQRGRYAQSRWGPALDALRRDVRQELADPTLRGPEFAPASLHSYPALAFLLYVPLVWVGLASTLPLSLAALVALLVAVGRALPPQQRLVGWALLLANPIGVVLTLRGSFEAVALLLALLAWQTLPRRALSPALLGLACAVKQVVWPLAPLYLIVSVRREGWRVAARRGAILLAAFLAPNLPFAIASPLPWARSLLLPVSLPLFPGGVGFIGLARGGVLPLWPQPVYTLLELAAFAGLAAYFAFRRPMPRPELALLLGLLPFALAWRSLVSYFALLPVLALYAALPLLERDAALSLAPSRARRAPATAVAPTTPPAQADHPRPAGHALAGAPALILRRPLTGAASRALPQALALLAPPRLLGSSRPLQTLRAALRRWLARADVRAALVTTLMLRVACTLAAAAVPLALPDLYPWHGLFLPDHFTLVNAAPGGPHPRYSLLDYLLLPWDRWDTSWYTDIAQHGYTTYGSTAFMPLYPLLIRITAPLAGGNPLAAALLLATAATFLALLALYRLAERLAPGRGLGGTTLLVAALLPLSFFLVAGYTESLFLACSLWAILAALDGRWGRMALLAALAALTRQQGVLLAILAVPAAWRALAAVWRRLTPAMTTAGHPRQSSALRRGLMPLVAVAAPGVVYAAWLGALRLALHALLPWEVLTQISGWDQRFAWPGPGLIADAVWLPQWSDALITGTELDLVMAVTALALLLASLRRLPPTLWLYLAALWCAAVVKVLPDGRTVSAGRYMLALLPLCVLPAAWLAGTGKGRRLARALWVVVGVLVSLLCLWAFILGGWVG
jgi:hypothetical protein